MQRCYLRVAPLFLQAADRSGLSVQSGLVCGWEIKWFNNKIKGVKRDSGFYKKGFLLAIKNAESLQKISKASADLNEFGIACSLNVLSAEEALKAIFLTLKSNYPNDEIEGFDKVFKNHKVKHNYIKEFLILNDNVQSNNLTWIKQLEPILDFLTVFTEKYSIKIPEELVYVKESIDWLKKKSHQKTDLIGVIDWLERANDDKNKGFYVDVKKNKWSAPQNLSSKNYEVEKYYSTNVINFALTLQEVFERVKSNGL